MILETHAMSIIAREEENRRQSAQQRTQAQARRRQQLTAQYGAALAEKIMVGNLEIGMNKAVCREIVGTAPVVNRTATTETWRIPNFLGGRPTFLYFSGDILVRVSNF